MSDARRDLWGGGTFLCMKGAIREGSGIVDGSRTGDVHAVLGDRKICLVAERGGRWHWLRGPLRINGFHSTGRSLKNDPGRALLTVNDRRPSGSSAKW